MEYHKLTLWIPKPRFGKRVSLRALLLIFVVVAIASGWRRDHVRLTQQLISLRAKQTAWSVSQLLGPPNARGSSDDRNAWASATQDGQQEWLILEFADAKPIDAILVYENYKPGALTKATAVATDGTETVLWEGVDPTPRTADRGVSELPVTYEQAVARVKLYLDSVAVPGWNEIDAVGVRDVSGQIQWASGASASSCYGGNDGVGSQRGNYLFVY